MERFDGKAAAAKDIKNRKSLLDAVMQFGYMPSHMFSNRVPYGISTLKVFSMEEVCVVAVAIEDLVNHESWPAHIRNMIVNEKCDFHLTFDQHVSMRGECIQCKQGFSFGISSIQSKLNFTVL